MSNYKIDINCDLGESYGTYTIGNDAEILKYISSANIACGFHAGDPSVMKKTVRMAIEAKVAIGAHPGLPDLAGFGRREMKVSPEEVYDMLIYQIGALQGFITSEGGILHHVKPHGALYNMVAVNEALAEAIAQAVFRLAPQAILYGLSGSALIRAGEKHGLKTASEVFADRTYQQDGTLTSRSLPDALIKDTDIAVRQVLRMVKEGKVRSQQGMDIDIVADTVCIHGDGPHAHEFAKQIYDALLNEGVRVES